jgi:hypothetical protein
MRAYPRHRHERLRTHRHPRCPALHHGAAREIELSADIAPASGCVIASLN